MRNINTANRRIALSVTSVASLSVAMAAFAAAPANARSSSTVCRDTIQNQSVRDVVVPRGASCTIKSAEVRGSVTVGQGARLDSSNTLIRGGVKLERNAGFALAHVGVNGRVYAANGSYLVAEGGELKGGLRGVGMSGVWARGTVVNRGMQFSGHRSNTYVYLANNARVNGDLTIANGRLQANGLTIRGDLQSSGTGSQSLWNTVVRGDVDLEANGARNSVAVCRTSVTRDVTAQSEGYLAFGGRGNHGCGRVSVNGDVDLTAEQAAVFGNRIKGDATAEFGSVRGADNIVRGTVSGDYPG